MSDENRDPGSFLRIGDDERNQAAEKLGEHLRAGRLEAHEYDERITTTFAAKTAGEIAPLFADLPGGSPLAPAVGPADRAVDRPPWAHHRRGWFVPPPVLMLALIAATVAWVVTVHLPPFFLIPVLVFLVLRRRRHYVYGRRDFAHNRASRGSGRRR